MPDEQPERVSLRVKLAEAISNIHPDVENLLVEKFKQAEVTRRADMISKAVEALEKLEKDHKKLDKPNNVTYDAQKNKNIGFTGDRINELAKLQKRIDAHVDAINDAISGDLRKLENLNRNPAPKDKKEGSGDPEDGADNSSD